MSFLCHAANNYFMCTRSISANDTIEKPQGRPESLHIGYLSPTAIVSELRHAQSADVFACVSVREGTVCGSGRVRIELRSKKKGGRSKGKSEERSQSAGTAGIRRIFFRVTCWELKKKIIICDYSRRVGAWGGSGHGGFSRPSLLQPVNHARLKRLIFVHALWLQCVHARVGRCEHTGVALGLHLPVCVYVRGIRRAVSLGDDDPQQFEFPPPTPSRHRHGGHGGIPPTVKGEAIVNPPTFPTCWVVEQAAFLFAVRGEERDVAKQLQFTLSPIFFGVD